MDSISLCRSIAQNTHNTIEHSHLDTTIWHSHATTKHLHSTTKHLHSHSTTKHLHSHSTTKHLHSNVFIEIGLGIRIRIKLRIRIRMHWYAFINKLVINIYQYCTKCLFQGKSNLSKDNSSFSDGKRDYK